MVVVISTKKTFLNVFTTKKFNHLEPDYVILFHKIYLAHDSCAITTSLLLFIKIGSVV